jgi:hypothetical protein
VKFRNPAAMRFTFLIRAFSPSVGPLDTPVVSR